MDIRDKIVVIENDRNVIHLLSSLLKTHNYDVLIESVGSQALTLISSHCPDLIVIDLDVPDVDGNGLLKSLREWSSAPVIVLSSRTRERDKVDALDLGADDYITKPFGNAEFLARIRSLLRRRQSYYGDHLSMNNGVFRTGALSIDFNKHSVMIDGKNAGLTQTEYRLVSFLARHAGKVVTYNMIMQEIWGPNSSNDNRILRVNMANIRRKIEKNPAEPEYIFTEAGVGYSLRDSD